jgi:hypothetical protein
LDILLLPPEIADSLRLTLLVVTSGLALVVRPRVVEAPGGYGVGLVVLQMGAVRPRVRVRMNVTIFTDELARAWV